jgi:short-subunit dehydrogenase
MQRSLAGRRLLITGASRGIGRALAEQAASAGAWVAVAARSAERLESLVATLTRAGHRAFAVPVDVTVDEERRRLLDMVCHEFGGLDVLINNAGVASFGHFSESSEVVLRRVMEVNFFAAAELMRLAVPALRRGREPAVVNVASVCGRRGLPAWPEHSASKFALCGLTEALRGEFVRFGIDVLLVLPGLTRTDPARHLLRNEGRMKFDFTGAMPPEQVASHILAAVQKNRAETVVGWQAAWLLRANRIWPGFVNRMLARKVRQLYASGVRSQESGVRDQAAAAVRSHKTSDS